MSSAPQLPLFSEGEEVKDTEDTLYFELKPYLQPFERVLARAELAGLLPDAEFDGPFGKLAEESTKVESEVDAEFLRHRLAYWQRVGDKNLSPTLQVLLEATASEEVDGDYENLTVEGLHSRRLHRYGPHDLHEYRGKFFPPLVRSLINFAGLQEGDTVVDPFCGSGTSIVEARALNMAAVGVDLNPLSVLISRAKARVMELSPSELQDCTRSFLDRLPEYNESDYSSRWSEDTLDYLAKWFAEEALSDLHQILQAIEDIGEGPFHDLLRVSLSNIVRSVSWQKESDLRVRKEKFKYSEGQSHTEFTNELRDQVDRLIPYLEITSSECALGAFDVRSGDTRQSDSLLQSYKGKCDVLITSPPYATALPYIDTDRLSLMILGMMSRDEQRPKEREMIGNREINKTIRSNIWETYNERKEELPPSVSSFIDELADDYHTDEVGFRRRNLPSLLSKYYLDMLDSMKKSRSLLKPGKLGFFVVGNNFTRVDGEKKIIPTDQFIWEIGEAAGWQQEAMLDMEMIPSQDIFKKNTGSSEKVLAFRSAVERKAIYSSFETDRFQPGKSDWDFPDADTRKHLHTLHSYPARFIPQIPSKAIDLFTDVGDTTLDPFAGCGTTALESTLMGRPSIAVDNNAVACLVTEAKTADYSSEEFELLREFASGIGDFLPDERSAEWTPSYKNFEYWFEAEAISDLSRLRAAISELSGAPEKFALAVFSSIIVSISNQDSDTRYKRVEKNYVPGTAIRKFKSNLSNCIKGLREIIDKPNSNSEVHLSDAREISFVDDKSVDLIVTSPPYLNAYDYHKYHRHRLHWIEGDVPFARDQELGKHDKYTRSNANPDPYFENMETCFREWVRVLKSGSRALVVVGDAIVNRNAVPVAERLIDRAAGVGLETESHWTRSIPKDQKSFNKKSRIDEEHMLLFVKP